MYKTLILLSTIVSLNAYSQNGKQYFIDAYKEQLAMLQGRKPMDFKRAVFITESAYLKGTILLLGCFQATPKYDDKIHYIHMDGEFLTKQLSSFSNRNVIGNQGSTYGGSQEFSGNFSLSGKPESTGAFADFEQKFSGNWSITQPNGTIRPLGDITLNTNGQIGNYGAGLSPVTGNDSTAKIPNSGPK